MAVARDNNALPSWNMESNQVGNNHIQRVALDIGTPGVACPVEGALPVSLIKTTAVQPISGTITADAGTGTFSVSGTVAIDGTVPVSGSFYQTTQPISADVLPLPTGAATESSLSSIDNKITACNTSDISGTVVVNNFPTEIIVNAGSGTFATSGTFFQDIQPISGTVTALSALVPAVYDYISLSYTGKDLTEVVYKTGGADGTTIATLTLAYTDGDLVSVTKS